MMEPMIELEKRISGDWIDLREAAADLYSLQDFLKLPAPALTELASALKLAVEGGELEYKESVLRSVLNSLESAKYQSLAGEDIDAHLRPLEGLLLVILVQKLLCLGVLPQARPKSPEAPATEDLDVNLILKDIRNRIQANPEAQKHPAVKNIYLQLALYQKEKQKMEELRPNIKPDKRATFQENFQGAFEQVFESIRKNYAALLTEEAARAQEARSQEDLFRQLPLKGLSPLLTEQAREVSRLRSTLAYTLEDKYKTRDPLVRLYQEKPFFLKLLEREEAVYRQLCRGPEVSAAARECALQVSFRFREELVRVIERLARSEEGR